MTQALVVMARGQIRGQGNADPGRELHVQVQVGGRIVEAGAYLDQLIGIHAVHQPGCCVVAVIERLHLLRESRSPVEPESVVRHLIILGRLKNGDAALILRAQVLDGHCGLRRHFGRRVVCAVRCLGVGTRCVLRKSGRAHQQGGRCDRDQAVRSHGSSCAMCRATIDEGQSAPCQGRSL